MLSVVVFTTQSLQLSSPHFDFGLLKAVWHKVDILKRCDDAFLLWCNFGVERHYPCITRERMLSERDTVEMLKTQVDHLINVHLYFLNKKWLFIVCPKVEYDQVCNVKRLFCLCF